MRPDTHTVGQLDTAFEHATHVYEYVATAMQLAAQVKAGRVSQGHALLKQATRLFALPVALSLRLLATAIDAQRFPGCRWMRRINRPTVFYRKPPHLVRTSAG